MVLQKHEKIYIQYVTLKTFFEYENYSKNIIKEFLRVTNHCVHAL